MIFFQLEVTSSLKNWQILFTHPVFKYTDRGGIALRLFISYIYT